MFLELINFSIAELTLNWILRIFFLKVAYFMVTGKIKNNVKIFNFCLLPGSIEKRSACEADSDCDNGQICQDSQCETVRYHHPAG